MIKIQKLLELYQIQLQELITSPDEYNKFIRFAAPLYKYPFSEVALVYAQRPTATLCAEFEFWTSQMGLSLKGAKGIPIVRNYFGQNRVAYLFDIQDVCAPPGKKLPKGWSASDVPPEQLIQMVNGNKSLLYNRIIKHLDVLVHQEHDGERIKPFTDMQTQADMAQAAEVIVKQRLGLDTSAIILSPINVDNILFSAAHGIILGAAKAALEALNQEIKEWRKNSNEHKETTVGTGATNFSRGNNQTDRAQNSHAGTVREVVDTVYASKLSADGNGTSNDRQVLSDSTEKGTESAGNGAGYSGGVQKRGAGQPATRHDRKNAAGKSVENGSGRNGSRADVGSLQLTLFSSGTVTPELDERSAGVDNGIAVKTFSLAEHPQSVTSPWDEYRAIKDTHQDETVLFQVGDFYEMFGEDARQSAVDLDIALISRDMGLPERVEMCGIPKHTLEGVTQQLLEKGHSVAVVSHHDGQYTVQSTTATTTDIKSDRPINFCITSEQLGAGGAKAKYKNNVTAIRTLQAIEQDGRSAMPNEQEILNSYIGWGGLPQTFDSRNQTWEKEYAELSGLLTQQEYEMARASTLNAHYTSPEIIKAMYTALDNLGFVKGRILEPAMGAGYFFGLMPQSMRAGELFGVELDSITGRIAKQLYPTANIQIKGFQETTFLDEYFDVAIGNVPFGGYSISDNKYSLLIHDYFFVKSLDKLRTGGILAYITSKGTLDKENPEARRMIAQRADLLGAIRLPNTAFKEIAATEVTTDIIFLQKRAEPPEDYPDWVYLGDYDAGKGIKVNQYYLDHPDMMLGTMELGSSMYNGAGRDTTLVAGDNWLKDLWVVVGNIKGKYTTAERKIAKSTALEDLPLDYAVSNRFSYQIVDGSIYYNDGVMLRHTSFDRKKTARIKGMSAIRDAARDIISLQMQESYTDTQLATAQEKLSSRYDTYTAEYGYINDRANQLAFQEDIDIALISSLEDSSANGKYVKNAFFHKATIKKRIETMKADSSIDALLISLNEKNCVDLEYMEALSGFTHGKLIDDLEGRVFRDHSCPESIRYLSAEEYLSGDVRTKLGEAQAAALEHPEFQANVTALEKVQPEWITAADIGVRLSTHWIGVEYINQFIYELLKTPSSNAVSSSSEAIRAVYKTFCNEWSISNKTIHSSVLTSSTYGTTRIGAYHIIEQTLNQREITIHDPYEEDGKTKYRYNHGQTILARQKQELIEQQFKDWIFKAPERRIELERKYNLTFNRTRPREYDGSYMTLPDTNPLITLRSHQKNGIARIRSGENVLLAHVVGAGKTFTMISGGMELVRLGAANKLLYVVPNHIIGDFAGDFMKLYPSARVLVPNDSDFEKANRRKFIAKIATADINAIVIGHSQFAKIDVSPRRKALEIQSEIEALEHALEWAHIENGPRYTVKQLEKSKMALTEKMNHLLTDDNKDNLLYFEELGVDTLFVDEAHNFKNGAIHSKMSNVAGVQSSSSLKASDLLAKCRYITEMGKSVVFATGTPLSNSICEMYVMQRYLQEEELHKRGMYHFDEWASNFGETVTSIELRPEGGGYRSNTRFSRFFNLPELMNMFREVADIQTAEMLDLPRPKLHDGKATVIACEPSEDLLSFMDNCIVRATKIRAGTVNSSEDNMLKMTGEARKAGTDMRLLDSMAEFDEHGKLNKCAENIAEHYKQYHSLKGTQLIFSDIGTPNPTKFNVYDELRRLLMNKGIPAEEIAYIHEAKTDKQKERLFEDVRSGKKRNLIGSTAKCGAGTNIQDRLIALHHIDCPWRPSDIEQREGRILRQGNKNDEVYIYRYVTKRSFDSYLWQLVEQKQRFISQVMGGNFVGRTCKDIDDAVLSFAEVKAIASGDPRIRERMELEMSVEKLLLLKKQYDKQVYHLQDMVSAAYPKRKERLLKDVEEVSADLIGIRQYPSDIFAMEVKGNTYQERSKAADMLFQTSCSMAPRFNEFVDIGQIKGLDMLLTTTGEGKTILLQGKHRYAIVLGESAIGNIKRIENKVEDISEIYNVLNQQLEELDANIDEAEKQIAIPFQQQNELQTKQQQLIAITAEINVTAGVVQGEMTECAIVSEWPIMEM